MKPDIAKFPEGQNELKTLFERSYALEKLPLIGKAIIEEPWKAKLYGAVNTATYVLPLSIFAAMGATEQSMPAIHAALIITNAVALSLTASNLACSLIRGKSLLYVVRKRFGKRQNGMTKVERMEFDYNLKMTKHRKLAECTQKQRDKLMKGTPKMIEQLNANNLKYSFEFTEGGLTVKEREDTAPLFKVLEIMNSANAEVSP